MFELFSSGKQNCCLASLRRGSPGGGAYARAPMDRHGSTISDLPNLTCLGYRPGARDLRRIWERAASWRDRARGTSALSLIRWTKR